MAPTRDHCLTCGRLVLRDQGVAFRDGGIIDLPCFLEGKPEPLTHGAPAPPNQTLLGVHVCVVEDDGRVRELLCAVLEYSGGFVTTAKDATEGKAMLRDVHPHVLVTDISMPNDGLEMVREVIVFAAETGLVVPAVAISGSRDGRDHLREAGFAAFIPKPLDPFVLAVVVAKLHQERRKT
jgi:CheY-like chemotaxis protein